MLSSHEVRCDGCRSITWNREVQSHNDRNPGNDAFDARREATGGAAGSGRIHSDNSSIRRSGTGCFGHITVITARIVVSSSSSDGSSVSCRSASRSDVSRIFPVVQAAEIVLFVVIPQSVDRSRYCCLRSGHSSGCLPPRH